MKRSEKDMDRAVRVARKQTLFTRLDRLYGRLPEGTCVGCTSCCSESVPTFFIEFANIWQYLQNHPQVFQERLPKVLSYYHTELAVRRKCPFLQEDHRCAIYEVRPLTCRLFGFSSQQDFQKNLDQVLRANRQAKRDLWNAYRLDVSEDVVDFHIPFCQDFQPEWLLSEEDKLDLADELFSMDSAYLMAGLLDEEDINQTLVPWFVQVFDSLDDASERRIQVAKEWTETGKSSTLSTLKRKWNKEFANKII